MTNLTKHLTLSILLCLGALSVSAQKHGGKDEKDDKKAYPPKVKVWQLDEYYAPKEYDLDKDTSLHLFQLYDNNDRNSISVSNLGNMGSPYISNIFEDRMRARQSRVFFMDYMSDFISKPEDTKYYQVNHPYTSLYYSCTPKARNGQTVDFTHSQNVNEKLNWGFNIGLVSSAGRYSHQHTRNVNVTPQISYRSKHLSVHFFYKFNKNSLEENGGIEKKDSLIVQSKRFTTLLETPFSNWGMRTWNLVGEYSLGKTEFDIKDDTVRTEIYTPRIKFGYIMQFNKIFRTHEDPQPGNNLKFYDNFFVSKTATYDSLYYHCLTNRLQVDICETKYTPELRGAIGTENEKYFNFQGLPYQKEQPTTTMNSYIEGSIRKNKSKNLILNGRYRQYLTGLRSGDMLVNGDLGFKIFKGESDTVNYKMNASAEFRREKPTYFEKKYYSNNFQWAQDFDKEKTQTLRVGGEIEIPRWHMKIGASNYLIKNYVYINEEAKPTMYKGDLTVQSLSIMKDFYVWKLRFANRATLQNSKQNSILCLPKYALYHATYLEFFLVKNVLLTQLGGEVRYSGEYNAFGYQPATSLFYLQPRKDGRPLIAGNYPIISGFANIKIHGVLMFFKWEHIDNKWFGKDWYASTDHYPMQDFHFMFGILWRFKD